MFGNWDLRFVYYDNNVKIDDCILFVFFYNDSNINLVLIRVQSLYGRIGTDRLSRYVVNFVYVSAFMFCYAEK